MPQTFKPKVATSNHLTEGCVIYYARPEWTRTLAKATVALTEGEAEALLAEAETFQSETVGVVLIPVDLMPGGPVPTHFREVFRTKGPSNYIHGKHTDHV